MNTSYKSNIIILILGSTVSRLSLSVLGFALSLYVLDKTSSAAAFSTVISLAIVPGIAVNMLASVLVDKIDRKKIIVLSDAGTGLLLLFFMIFIKMDMFSIIILIIFYMCISTVQALFDLAMDSSIPNLVDDENVPRMNSISQMVGSAIQIAAPIIGAIAYKGLKLETLFLVAGILYIFSAISEMFLKFDRKPLTDDNFQKEGYMENIRVTFKYLSTKKILIFFFVFAAVTNFIYNPLIIIMLPYVNYSVLKVSGLQLSVISASGTVGVLLMSFIMSVKADLNRLLLKKFFILFCVQAVIAIMWVFPSLSIFKGGNMWTVVIIFSLLLVVFEALSIARTIPMTTYFQLSIPDELRGRVFGAFKTAMFLTTPVGIWLYGILLEKIGWDYVTATSGALMLILGVLAGRNKHVEGLQENSENNI